MKAFPCLLVSLSFFAVSHSLAGPAEFSLSVEVTLPEGDPIVVRMPKLALEVEDDVDISLPVITGTAIVSFDFNFVDGLVYVEIEDASRAQVAGERLKMPTIARGAFAIEFGKKTMVVESPLGSIAFTLTAPEGWKPTGRSKQSPSRNLVPLSKEEMETIDHETAVQSAYRGIYLRLYNPTDYLIEEAVIRIQAPAAEGFKAVDRLYKISDLGVKPMEDGSRSRDLYFLNPPPEGTDYTVTLESVLGYKAR